MIDLFLNVSGVTGDSADADHKGWIDVISCSWGLETPITLTSVLTPGKSAFQPLVVSTRVGRHTPVLWETEARGAAVGSTAISGGGNVTLDLVQWGELRGITILRVSLFDVRLAGYSLGIDPGGDIAGVEQWQFTYGKIRTAYTPIKLDGTAGTTITKGWNVATNAAF